MIWITWQVFCKSKKNLTLIRVSSSLIYHKLLVCSFEHISHVNKLVHNKCQSTSSTTCSRILLQGQSYSSARQFLLSWEVCIFSWIIDRTLELIPVRLNVNNYAHTDTDTSKRYRLSANSIMVRKSISSRSNGGHVIGIPWQTLRTGLCWWTWELWSSMASEWYGIA